MSFCFQYTTMSSTTEMEGLRRPATPDLTDDSSTLMDIHDVELYNSDEEIVMARLEDPPTQKSKTSSMRIKFDRTKDSVMNLHLEMNNYNEEKASMIVDGAFENNEQMRANRELYQSTHHWFVMLFAVCKVVCTILGLLLSILLVAGIVAVLATKSTRFNPAHYEPSTSLFNDSSSTGMLLFSNKTK